MSSFVLKLYAAYSAVQGRSSCFIETRAAAGTGKSYEDELVLSCFDETDIISLADVTYAGLFELEECEIDKKIIMLGDLGNKHFVRLENVFSVFKQLITEHEYKRKHYRAEQALYANSLCVMYETTKQMTDDEQITSRCLQFSTKHTQDDLLDLFIAEKNRDEQELVQKYRAEIAKKRQLNIHVEHEFIQLFADEVRQSHVSNKIRKLEQLLNLFESYCILETDIDTSCTVRATREQYDEFMKLVCDCYFCSDVVVQDFVKMLRESKLEAVDLQCLVEDVFDDAVEDLDEKKIVSVLYRRYGLNGRSKLFKCRHVFFSVHSLRKEFRGFAAFENVDDLLALLGFLVKQGVVGVLGSFRATKIYYLKIEV